MNKQLKIIIGLSIIIILLFGFIGYNFAINYQQSKYLEFYQEGQIDTIIIILDKIQTDGYIQLTYMNETYILVLYQGEVNENI